MDIIRKNDKKIAGKPKRTCAPKLTAPRLLNAIIGSAGIKRVIAARLGVTYAVVWGALKREGAKWEDCRIAIKMEEENVADIAEITVQEMMQQRLEINVAATTARWYLEKRKKGYESRNKVTVEGGENPIKINQTYIPIHKLKLPLKIKVQVLEAMDKYQKDNGINKDD